MVDHQDPPISSNPAPEVPGTPQPQAEKYVGTLQRRYIDRSGKLATGAAQVLCGENTTRRSLVIQNQGTHNMFVDFDTDAVAGVPSFVLQPNDFVKWEIETGFVPTGRVSIIGTATETYAAREV